MRKGLRWNFFFFKYNESVFLLKINGMKFLKPAELMGICLLLMLTGVVGTAQTTLPRNSNGIVEYTEVVYVDSSISKEVLYSAARAWFIDNFRDAKEVLQVQDKDACELIGKGNINIPSNRFGYMAIGVGIVWFKFSFFAKDGRYKYSITDFNHEGGLPQIRDCGSLDDDRPDSCSRSIFEEVKEKTHQSTLAMIADFKATVLRNLNAAKDDW